MSTKTLLDLSQEKTAVDCVKGIHVYYAKNGTDPDLIRLSSDLLKELGSECSLYGIELNRLVDMYDPSLAEEGYVHWGMFKGIPVVL